MEYMNLMNDNDSSELKEAKDKSLLSVQKAMDDMLSGVLTEPVHLLASLDPGAGKTNKLCSFLQDWKTNHFSPSQGALIVLATLKEIESCIERAGLAASDYAVLVHKGAALSSQGQSDHDQAPILFTTHEMLRIRCQGRSFADTSCYHFHGRPRALRVWDEAFMPAKEALLRKDHIVQPLADLRLRDPVATKALEVLADSLEADSLGRVVSVPPAAASAHKAIQSHLGHDAAERLSALKAFGGRDGVVITSNGLGLHLAGAIMPLPDDFAPCLILDASGRVRETYRTMEAAGTLKRLTNFTADYSRLQVHHWNRAASRSTLKGDDDRHEVLASVAKLIAAEDDKEPWLVVHAQDRPGQGYSVVDELRGLVANRDRLSFLHWGNHHGTNEYRLIRRVVVLGLWRPPLPVYSALHIAAGGPFDLATDKGALDAIEAGEHRHNLLQAICRASVRNGTGGTCGDCVVYVVDKLKDGAALLHETFPGASVAPWKPAGQQMPKAAQKLSLAIEAELKGTGSLKVSKASVRMRLGIGPGLC
jgi:hypothetical protein